MEKDKLRKNKLTVCALTVCAALCVCACGENAGTNPNTIILKNPASGQTQEQDNDVMQENVDSPAEDDQQRDGIGTDTESDTNVSNSDSSVTVVMVSEDDVELTTDDGTVYYTITCSYPVVSIADNEAAAGKINADIRTRVDAYNTSVNAQAEIAKADFEYLLNDDDYDFTPYAYSSDLSFTVTRADDHVIAFTENSYEYMGGAHGLPNTIGINYDRHQLRYRHGRVDYFR